MYETYERPKYVIYRKKRIPGWWVEYLPLEQNPYKSSDTLTLEQGCLCEYWHSHSSNKHYNPKGAEACNAVQEMIYYRFGGAFLTSPYGIPYGGHQGQKVYHEPTHLLYENAYLKDGHIHIRNARKYYEDVIIFMFNVLRMIATNHMPPGDYTGVDDFFPSRTDAEIEKSQEEARRYQERTKVLEEECSALISSPDFLIDSLIYESVSFHADYTYDDDWFNLCFTFNELGTNIEKEIGSVLIHIDVPELYRSNHEKKNPAQATDVLKLPYCFFLCCYREKTHWVTLPIPPDKVSDNVKRAVSEACNQAMKDYNSSHIEIDKTTKYYPSNFFLDNNIGKLDLVYTDDPWVITRWRQKHFI